MQGKKEVTRSPRRLNVMNTLSQTDANSLNPNDRAEVLRMARQLLKGNHPGVLSTVDENGMPQSRWMATMSFEDFPNLYTLTAANSRKSQRQNKLDFPILSDTRNDVAAAFGLRFALPDYLVDLYKSLKNDLPAFNDDPAWTLPMPARYVIGQDGVIAYAEVNPDYTLRPEPDSMLPVLERLTANA